MHLAIVSWDPVTVATMIGITASYLFEAREDGRLHLVISHPKENWRMFIFDYFACGFIGTGAAFYLFEAKTVKEGFLLGLTWEAILMAALNSRAKKKRRDRK
jgi:hypothetical protein